MKVHTVTTNAQLAALDLPYFTLTHLADYLLCVDPCLALESRIRRHERLTIAPAALELTTDDLGNYVSASIVEVAVA
jgi:hypothetical protein